MDRRNDDGMDVRGRPENTDRELNMTPGRLDDIESAEAYATRTGQGGEERMQADRMDREEMLDDDRMMDREIELDGGLRAGEHAAMRDIQPGDEVGAGLNARTPDGDRGMRDGDMEPGEDIGGGMRARPAEGGDGMLDGQVEPGEDLGHGMRPDRDIAEPGNPLV